MMKFVKKYYELLNKFKKKYFPKNYKILIKKIVLMNMSQEKRLLNGF